MECIGYLHNNFLKLPTFKIGEWIKGYNSEIKVHLITSCDPNHILSSSYESVVFRLH